jgi:hypothetical protein
MTQVSVPSSFDPDNQREMGIYLDTNLVGLYGRHVFS